MLTGDQVQLFKDIGYGVALGGFQAYNIWNHRKNVQRIKSTAAQLTVTYDDVKDDLDEMHARIESITVKLNGERRAPRANLTPEQIAAVRTDAQGRRYTDPPRTTTQFPIQ